MSLDPILNFAYGTVLTAPSPASSGTTLVLNSGEGARFPDPATLGAYNIVIWPTASIPLGSNAEIVRVTAKSSDTLTITRTREDSGARTIVAGDQVALSITKKMIDDMKNSFGFDGAAMYPIINGNFDIWQRGTTFTNPANSVRTADRWGQIVVPDGGTPPTLVHSRQLLTVGDIDKSFFFYRINTNGAGSSFGVNMQYAIEQRCEHSTRNLAGLGNKVTISFMAKSSIASKKVGVFATQTYGSGGSPSASDIINGTNWTLTSTWARYSYTFTLPSLSGKTFGTNFDDFILFRIYTAWGSSIASRVGGSGTETFVGSGNIDIAQVQVTFGEIPLNFNPRHFAEELALCQRYYEKSFAYDVAPAQNVGSNIGALQQSCLGASISSRANIIYKVPKRAVPTLTFYNPSAANANWRNTSAGADSGAASVSGSNSSIWGACIADPGVGGNSIGQNLVLHWDADCEL